MKILAEINLPDKIFEIKELKYKTFATITLKNFSIDKNPDLLIADQESEIAKSDLELSRLKNGPEVNLKTTAGYGSFNYMGTGQRFIDNDRVSWAGLLEFNYPLWDGRQKGLTAAISSKNSEAKKLAYDLLKESLTREFKITLQKFLFSQENYKSAQALTELENENFTFSETEYRGGRVNLFYLNDSLKTLMEARTAEIQALAECGRGYFSIKYLTGDLVDEISTF